MKKILIACEESQIVLSAFLTRGHYGAFSCDLKPASGEFKHRHLQADVFDVLSSQAWDMVIGFPPCTFLTRPQQWICNKSFDRRTKRSEAVEFVRRLYDSCPRVAIENPPGELSRSFRPYDQLVYPYQFGDPYRKEICLFLKGLPKLVVPGSDKWNDRRTSMQNKVNGRMSQDQKSEVKSKFFPGIADAMAEQWGSYISN
jgi:hypothetical protein